MNTLLKAPLSALLDTDLGRKRHLAFGMPIIFAVLTRRQCQFQSVACLFVCRRTGLQLLAILGNHGFDRLPARLRNRLIAGSGSVRQPAHGKPTEGGLVSGQARDEGLGRLKPILIGLDLVRQNRPESVIAPSK
jgi:hypothetical protein